MSNEQDCPYKETIKEHEKLIDRLFHGDWYDNKALFETMTAKFEEVSQKIDVMNENMRKYNGLIEKRQEDRKLLAETKKAVDQNKEKIDKIETAKEAKERTDKNWKDNINWILVVISFAAGLASRFIGG